MKLSTLADWLTQIEAININEIKLGLDRVRLVAEVLGLLSPVCPVIIVGGTNGKGSTVTALETIYRAAGFSTGVFTSPFLFRYNEQVRVNGQEAEDNAFCEAFSTIVSALGTTRLTTFEFHTLAALYILKQHRLDVMILEVGLGGRLDVVNIIDADVAVTTSIGIDHVDWLGSTREIIGIEKAGIYRQGKPVVCGDNNPPASLPETANQLGAPFYCQGKQFHYQATPVDWSWQSNAASYDHLPLASLATQNMSTALMVITLLQDRLPVKRAAIDQGLISVQLPGRIQFKPGSITEIYDVSHNPHAISFLGEQLKLHPCQGRTHAVFSMLADKDIKESILAICDKVDSWYVAPLVVKRAASANALLHAFHEADMNAVTLHANIEAAYDAARQQAVIGDRIIIFGSFHTVSTVSKVADTFSARALKST